MAIPPARNQTIGRCCDLGRTHRTGGGSCEGGYLDIGPEDLDLKATVEFNEALSIPMPNLKDFNVSVVYSLPPCENADAEGFLLASLKTVVERFPEASEVVLVADAADTDALRGVVQPITDSAPFPVRVVADNVPDALPPARVQSYRRLNADEYCRGDFVLHLEPTELLLLDVTYDSLFHFGKPVLPYGRHPDDSGECPLGLDWRRPGTS